MSAPHSIGRQKTGVGKVLSTISGTPWSCAAWAKRSMSSTSSAGLAMVSPKTARVLGRKAAASSSGVHVGETNVLFDAHLGHGVRDEVVRAAVDGRARHDVAARLAYVEEREEVCGLAGAREHGRRAALERADLGRHAVVGGILQTGVEVALGLQVKELAHVLGGRVLEGGWTGRWESGAARRRPACSRPGRSGCRCSARSWGSFRRLHPMIARARGTRATPSARDGRPRRSAPA